MKNLAIIPARSGSKGIKDKNIHLLCGKPLLAYTVKAAVDSGVFDEVLLATDSKRYAEIGTEYGSVTPYLRSAGTSGDQASSWAVVNEALKYYQELGRSFDTFCLLQPTSPLRTAYDIKSAYGLFTQKQANTVVSVCKAEHSPLFSNTLPENGCMDGFIPTEKLLPRQVLDTYYRLNGALYLLKTDQYSSCGIQYDHKTFAFIMTTQSSVDIDEETDFLFAELLMQLRENRI